MKRAKLLLLMSASIVIFVACNTMNQTRGMKSRLWVNQYQKKGKALDCLQVLLHDTWHVQRINSLIIDADNRPYAEIDLNKMIISGEDSCNSYSGKIKGLNENQIEFKALVSTRKMCQDMSVSKAFHNALIQVKAFKREGDQLYFFNEEGKLVMVLKNSGWKV